MLLDDLASLIANEPGRDPDAAKIADFESRTGFRIPEGLKQLLAKADGGDLTHWATAEWDSELYQGGRGRLQVAQLFGFTGESWRTIQPLATHIEAMEKYCAGVPHGIFCFADDWCGNVVTVDLRDQSYGTVAFVDHETVGHHFDVPETYQVVAKSFDDFVAMLRFDSEEEQS